jgi:serine/threonine-protein kinase RsbW
MTEHQRLLRLRFRSAYEMLDLVQVASDRVTQLAGLDDDAIHWVGVAVRESVINAIKHGNRQDPGKEVTVEFAFEPNGTSSSLVIRVSDEGIGFEPNGVADPLAPENLLKSSGRGIFFMRSFMDDVAIARRPEGGMEVRMVKKLAAASGTPSA